jgi:hypothetical protein
VLVADKTHANPMELLTPAQFRMAISEPIQTKRYNKPLKGTCLTKRY